MNTTNDGGPAFPNQADYIRGDGDEYKFTHNASYGMSLRDWYAGQALEGLLACPDASNDTQIIVKACFHIADAMLKAREQREEVAK